MDDTRGVLDGVRLRAAPSLRTHASRRQNFFALLDSARKRPAAREPERELPFAGTESGEWRLSAKAVWIDFTRSPPTLPNDLYDLGGSLGYRGKLEGDAAWGASLGANSASDRPFDDSSVSALNATAYYSFAPGPKHQWSVFLLYSSRRTVAGGVPLPGFVYRYFPSKEFTGAFGIPFGFLSWKFAEDWTLSAFALFPVRGRLSVSRRIVGPIQTYLAAEFARENFWISRRSNPDERLFFDDSRVVLGARSPLSQVFFAELELGCALDRRFGYSEKTFAPWRDARSLGGGFTSRLGLSASF